MSSVDTSSGWLPPDELQHVRDRVPIPYVEAVPVRVDHLGRVVKVGLLLRVGTNGELSRAVVSGRVLYGETVAEALWRNLSKDLGAEAEPQLPANPAPFTIAEYFPDKPRRGFTDPRQHSIALVYLVPVGGECTPAQDALEVTWLTPAEAASPGIAAEMTGGQDRLVQMALAHAGQLP